VVMARATKRLMVEFRELMDHPTEGILAGPLSEDSFTEWECFVAGPTDTPFEGGVFRACISFPSDYPLSPPKMKFTSALWHPNIYGTGARAGEVCISILHAPGNDAFGYERSCERWSPVQSVEKILLSVVSMLAEPNCESPANVDAAKMYRDHREQFNAIVRQNVRDSLGL